MIHYAIFHGLIPDKSIARDIKYYLYNNRNNKIDPPLSVPENRDHKIYRAITKDFTWKDVEDTITIIDKLDIGFNEDLELIHEQLIQRKAEKHMTPELYTKVMNRLDKLIKMYYEPAN